MRMLNDALKRLKVYRFGICEDCYRFTLKPTHWGLGAVRCEGCSDVFSAEIYARRCAEERAKQEARQAHEIERDAAGTCPDDGEACKDCCAHEFDWSEGGYCLDCDTHYSE